MTMYPKKQVQDLDDIIEQPTDADLEQAADADACTNRAAPSKADAPVGSGC